MSAPIRLVGANDIGVPVNPSTGALHTQQAGDPDGNSLMLVEGWCPELLAPARIRVDSAGQVVLSGTEGGGANALPSYDYKALAYTNGLLTQIVYRLGGVSGTIVATLTLGYDGSNNLVSVLRS